MGTLPSWHSGWARLHPLALPLWLNLLCLSPLALGDKVSLFCAYNHTGTEWVDHPPCIHQRHRNESHHTSTCVILRSIEVKGPPTITGLGNLSLLLEVKQGLSGDSLVLLPALPFTVKSGDSQIYLQDRLIILPATFTRAIQAGRAGLLFQDGGDTCPTHPSLSS